METLEEHKIVCKHSCGDDCNKKWVVLDDLRKWIKNNQFGKARLLCADDLIKLLEGK